MGFEVRKPVFGVSEKARLKPNFSDTETSWKIEISLVEILDMILLDKQITKALISLHTCAGWSAPVLFANPRRQVLSCRGPYDLASASDIMPCIKIDKPLVVYRFW